tara:strand:- start:1890 stop:2582 length:693 start_codon:yes stop_codon:yes gene_type:complete
MTDEEDMARDARSVACADAPGRVFDEVTDIGFRTSYTEVSEPYDFTVDLTTRRDGKRFIGISAGDAGIEWPCELLDWLMTALTRIKAARSESEDTQPKATHTQEDVDALVRLREMMLLPDPEDENSIGVEGTFDPWALFPNVYGSYDAAFDVCAVEVLTDILEGQRRRDDLASDIFREMLCSMGLCEYGTSPRVCFPAPEFRQVLPTLIERWKRYYLTNWGAALTPFQKG